MINNSNIIQLVSDLKLSDKGGRNLTNTDHILTLRKLAEQRALTTLEPLLPLCLQLQGKPYTLQNHYPFSPVFKTEMPKNLVLKTGRQVSKTILKGSMVQLSNGNRVAVQKLKIGDKVLSVDTSTNKIIVENVIDTINAGNKECVEIKTQTGRILRLALTHPLLKLTGWTTAAKLKINDKIALAKQGGFFCNKKTSENQLTSAVNNIKISNTIPSWVFDLSKLDTSLFISKLWSAHGTIEGDKPDLQISYTSTSEKLARDLQSLLSKFCISTTIKQKQNTYTVDVVTKRDQKLFLNTLTASREGLQNTYDIEDNTAVERQTEPVGDLIWDRILEIRSLGSQHCYDIEVSNTHNYLIDGIVSHNSTSIASHGVVLANCIPYFRQLYVTPLYEQIRRFSNNYVRPFIDRSPIKDLWVDTNTEKSVLQRSFRNKALMIFSFAFLDANRIRGISGDACDIDEIQDFDLDHLAVIREVLSYSDWGLMKFTGTPKSLDNALEGLWQKSSMAEWIMRCDHCGFFNVPSLDNHLNGMLGPFHEDISEKVPGIVCYRCQKPIYPRNGRWVHRYPNRRHTMSGYHIPQIIMPLHYARPDKWSELLAKREGWGNMTVNEFYNEVMGESVDVGQKLVTETDLKKASCLPFRNNPNRPDPEVMNRLRHYKTKVLACDWSGGGELEVSFTVLTLLGMTVDGKIDCLWGKKLIIGTDHLDEAKQCLHWANVFDIDCFAHDYTGAGIVRETVLVQAGFKLERVMPVQYVRAASNNIIRYIAPTPIHARAHYRLDKTRSLLYTCQAIKLGLLRFFEYDYTDTENPGLIADFLSLMEEKTESRSAGDIYVIKRNLMKSDDFAQATNIGCAALWHINDAWPNFAEAASVANITKELARAAGSEDYGWNEDRTMSPFFNNNYI